MENKYKKWSLEEDLFIKKHYGYGNKKMSIEELAICLKRNFNSVKNRIAHLKLIRSKPWYYNENFYLEREYLKGTPLKEIAEHLGRSENECVRQANNFLGITRKGYKEE